MTEKDLKIEVWLKPQHSPDDLRITDGGVSVPQKDEGVGQREAVFPSLGAQSVSVVRSAGDSPTLPMCTPQPATATHSQKADSCIHSAALMITHTHGHTLVIQTHVHPEQEQRALNTITFSSLFEGRKNSGATQRLLCPCGKTHGRLSQRNLGRPLNKGPAVEQEVTSGTAQRRQESSSLRWPAVGRWEESQNWHWYNSLQA